MDWTPFISGAGSALVAGGVVAGLGRWVKAKAKKAEAEADAVTLDAQTDAETRKAEATAKVKTLEAQAEEARVDAAKDQEILNELATLRQEVRDCETHRENERKWCHEQIAELRGRVDVLYDKAGLTPRDNPKVNP